MSQDVEPAALIAPTLTPQIRKVMSAGLEPKTFAQLKNALKAIGLSTAGKNKVADDVIRAALQEEIVAGNAFEHEGKKYSNQAPPPSLMEQILKQIGATEKKAALDLTAQLTGAPKPSAITKALKDLVAAGKLFVHGSGKKTTYTKFKPPELPWYESEPYQKSFDALLKAAKKVVDTGKPWEEIQTAVRQSLDATAENTPHVIVEPVVPTPAIVSPPVVPSPPHIDLRHTIREAYDYLCKFVEFQDKLVEIRRLFYETEKRIPGLTVNDFHTELQMLEKAWLIELHEINEVREAKDRHLAIERDGRMFYYLRWK